MPNLASSKKSLRRSRKRARTNAQMLSQIRKTLRDDPLKRERVQSLIDKAAKRKIFHPNKAARLKGKIQPVAKVKS